MDILFTKVDAHDDMELVVWRETQGYTTNYLSPYETRTISTSTRTAHPYS